MSKVENNLVVDPSPFGPNFKSKINGMVADEIGEVAKKTGKTAAAVVPLAVLTGCSADGHIKLDNNQVLGFASGAVCAIEEAFEKDSKRNFGKKVVSIASKFGAGYVAGYAISHNVQNGSWLSEENLTSTISLIPAAYVLARETSFSQLSDRFISGVQKNVSASSEARKEQQIKRDIEHYLRLSGSANLKTRADAFENLRRMGLNDKIISDLRRGALKIDDLSFRQRK